MLGSCKSTACSQDFFFFALIIYDDNNITGQINVRQRAAIIHQLISLSMAEASGYSEIVQVHVTVRLGCYPAQHKHGEPRGCLSEHYSS